jgi:uncharacterized protein (DUF983 family)
VLRANAAPDAHLHRFSGVLIINGRCGSCGETMLFKQAVCTRPHCTFTLTMPGQAWRACRG